jgi:YVTN family beta-propeller protein
MVISDSTNTVVATIPVGESPYNIAYDSAKGELFVTNSYDNTVSVISDSTNTVVATIPVGTEPFSIAYDSGKSEIFVVNFSTDTRNYSLSVISDSTNTVVATVALPGYPSFLVYDSGKGEIFVPTGIGTNSGVVTVISDSTNAVVATISNLNEAQIEGLVYDSGREQVFVALHQSNKVVAISDSTNKVVETIPVGHLPWVGTYDSGNGAIYFTNSGDNTVSVIAGASTTSATPNPSSFDFGSIIWIIIIMIIIILLIIIILIWLSRQRKFTVTVQNSQTQSPISGANVSSSGPQDLSGTTNNKGQTVFDDFKDGDYTIKANATGYIASMPMSVSVKNKTEIVIKLNPTPSEGPKKDSGGNGSEDEGKANSVVAQQSQQTQTPMQSAPILTTTPPPPPSPQEPTEPQGWRDEKIQQIIQKFQEKGAISPQTAQTAKELGLSRIFVRIMERRREQTKMFVEVNGKYYLDQKALEEKKQ